MTSTSRNCMGGGERKQFVDDTCAATDLAREWDGWGTALKPSHEPIILARKPCEGSFAANAEKWGVAGLNVDGCRVRIAEVLPNYTVGAHCVEDSATINPYFTRENQQARAEAGENPRYSPSGRWPPNTVFSHAPGCRCVGVEKQPARDFARPQHNGMPTRGEGAAYGGALNSRRGNGYADPDGTETVAKWICADGCPVRLLGEQSGAVGAAAPVRGDEPSPASRGTITGKRDRVPGAYHADRGTAARFFPQFEAEPFLYCAKASRAERERGLENTQPADRPLGISQRDGQTNGNGEVMGPSAPTRNPHPTVKPLALMRWLCRLTKTPTGGIVLDPFGGSGTTAVAALLEGREFILIEQDPSYCDIARARIADAIRNHQPTLQEVAQ